MDEIHGRLPMEVITGVEVFRRLYSVGFGPLADDKVAVYRMLDIAYRSLRKIACLTGRCNAACGVEAVRE